MTDENSEALPSQRQRCTVVAIDLGAESCRVSLLRWNGPLPEMVIVYRFPNGPVQHGNELRWNLDAIEAGVEEGLRRSAALAPEGIDAVAVDGWAVDYVRLDREGRAIAAPFCYRDERTVAAEEKAHREISVEKLYKLTGVQNLRFNTVYQLYADRLSGAYADVPWINLPEYVLHKLGGRRVSEYTNATHTSLVDVQTKSWCEEIFAALDLDIFSAPELVLPGTEIGKLSGTLANLPAFRDTRLIAPACHDTASAIAGISTSGSEWAYISSGTWSLVGTVLPSACTGNGAFEHGFTNLGAAGGKICFHTSVNGMWLIKQCMLHWLEQGHSLEIDEIIAAAEKLPPPAAVLRVDDPELLLPGNMPERINKQRRRHGSAAISESPSAAPVFANLIFHSLAARYAEVLSSLSAITGRTLHEICIVGGGSRNQFLNRLTEEASGLRVSVGHVESSTIGNFAIQLSALNRQERSTPLSAREISSWTQVLNGAKCVVPEA
jgi:rhamnulokinase